MKFKTRKRLALLVLVVGMPLYVIAAVTVVNLFERPPLLAELAIYVGLGVAWVLPFKRLFLGIARPDPDAAGGDGGTAAGENGEGGTAAGENAAGENVAGENAAGGNAAGENAAGGNEKAPR